MKPNPFWEKVYLVHCRVIKLILFILLSITAGLLAGPQQSDHVKAQLISEVQSVQPGQTFCVALRLQMDEHWHTYWKNPGDSGLPTKIDWNLPDGFIAHEIQWPYPQKFEENSLVSFGYEGDVLLITEIKAPETIKPGSRVEIKASVDWLVCKESCISGHADLMIDLPVKEEVPKINARWADHFLKTRMRLPKEFSDWKINASINKDKILIQITPPLWLKNELSNVTFFPEQGGIINYSGVQNLRKSKDEYIIEIQRSLLLKKLPAQLKGVLFSQKGWSNSRQERALRIDVPLHQY